MTLGNSLAWYSSQWRKILKSGKICDGWSGEKLSARVQRGLWQGTMEIRGREQPNTKLNTYDFTCVQISRGTLITSLKKRDDVSLIGAW